MKEYHSRKHSVNEDFFKKWSHDMAYVLGFWFADGCIHDSLFSISQHGGDIYILKSIAKLMKSEYPIPKVDKNSFRIYIYSKEIVRDIRLLGGKERKSLDVDFPYVPLRYLPDFVRGYFDGDGSISFYKKRNQYYSGFTCGSKRFIDTLYKRLLQHIPDLRGSFLEKKNGKSKNKIYVIKFSHNDTIRLGRFMYGQRCGRKLRLERKRDLFLAAGKIRVLKNGFLRYEDAKKFAHNLRLKSSKEWNDFSKGGKKPVNIPSSPNRTYENSGWVNWKEWLGYAEIKRRDYDSKFVSYAEAKKRIRRFNISSTSEWCIFLKRGLKPIGVPSSPRDVYKNKGWTNWKDWLGYTKEKVRGRDLSPRKIDKGMKNELMESVKQYEGKK